MLKLLTTIIILTLLVVFTKLIKYVICGTKYRGILSKMKNLTNKTDTE
jgi:hypothetical protein